MEENLGNIGAIQKFQKQFLPYWPLFAIAPILCLLVAYIYIRYTNPIWEIKAKILVSEQKKSISADDIAEKMDMFGEKKVVENEIEIIKSLPIFNQVVNNLHLNTSITRKGHVADWELYKNAPVDIIAVTPDSIKKPMKLYFSLDKSRKTIQFQVQDQDVN